jgi:hypothetical protein
MSETPDPLEAELAALRPHEVSPGLRRGVAERLADVPPPKLRWLWWLALAGGLAAACLAAILLWWGGGRRLQPEQVVRPTPPGPAVAVEDSGPTLLAYERALARSPEDLDALLDKDAGVAPEPNPELVRIGAFTRSDAALHALLGED